MTLADDLPIPRTDSDTYMDRLVRGIDALTDEVRGLRADIARQGGEAPRGDGQVSLREPRPAAGNRGGSRAKKKG